MAISDIDYGPKVQDIATRKAFGQVVTELTTLDGRTAQHITISSATTAGSLATDFNQLVSVLLAASLIDAS